MDVRAPIKRRAAPRLRAACFPLLGARSGLRREGSRVGILRGENEIALGWEVNVVGGILVGGFTVYCRRLWLDGLLVNDRYVLCFNCLIRILMVHISSHVILCIVGLLRRTGKVRKASSHHG